MTSILSNFYTADNTGGQSLGGKNQSLSQLFSNAGKWTKTIGGAFLAFLGIVMVIYGGFKIFKAVTGRAGSTGPEWGRAILALVIGGIFAITGSKLVIDVATTGSSTESGIVNGSGGSIMPLIDITRAHLSILSGGRF